MPGGFGKRGIEGDAERDQVRPRKEDTLLRHLPRDADGCIEFARNVCGLKDANSSEFDPAAQHRVIYKLRELWASKRWAERCGWARGHANSARDAGISRLRARRRSANGTGIVTSSIASTKRLMTGGGLQISGSTPDRHMSRCRDSGASLFHRVPVPSGVQVEAAGAASAVQGVYCG